ncbi:MAG: VWA domain-containing protein [Fimbriimonadales bacterium]|nr:VWA domain-containing protein [Fimbriimonadales bacterium]
MARDRGARSRSYEGDGQHSWLMGLAFLAILVLLGAGGWALWNYSRRQAIQIPLTVGAGFDVSQSMSREQKQRSVAFLNKLIGTVLPTRTPVKIWRYAEGLETVHESRPIASKDLTRVSRDTIENYMGKWGTRPDKVMQEFHRYIERQPDRKAVLCLFTDGECHSAQETRLLAQQLAQNPQVVVVVVGPVLNKYRAAVENEYYAPLRDAGKLFVFGETDALDTLERVKERLRTIEN